MNTLTTAGISLAIGVVINYSLIGWRWCEAAKAAPKSMRKLWISLMTIFLSCAIAGYSTFVIAYFAPRIANVVRVATLLTLNVLCPLFLTWATKVVFHAASKSHTVGEQLLRVAEETGLSEGVACGDDNIVTADMLLRMSIHLQKQATKGA